MHQRANPDCQRDQTREASLVARNSSRVVCHKSFYRTSRVRKFSQVGKKALRARGREVCPPENHVRSNVRWKTVVGHGTVTCTVKERATTSAFAGRESVARTRLPLRRRLPASPSPPCLSHLRPFTLSREILIGPRCVPTRHACKRARASRKAPFAKSGFARS